MIYNESKFNTEWDTLPLSKLGEFKRGKSKHRPRNDQKLFEGGTYPLIQTGEIKAANLLIKSHNAAYNEEGLKQSKMWPAGTLAITIAANIAETGILAYPMCFPDSCVGFNADTEKTTELFMHYVFTYIKRSIQNSAVGSIQDNINIEMLTALNFKIPKKPIQDLIVDLLSAIDYKIELNNDINTELENLAKTIYNYWFVQFDFPNENGKPYKTSGGEMEWNDELKREIPKGWTNGTLSEVANITMGQSPEGSSYNENGEGMVFYQGSTDFNFRFPEIRMYTTEPTRFAKEEDILLSVRAPVGTINVANEDCCIGRGLAALNSKNGTQSYLLYLMFYFKSMFDIQNRTGTTFGSIDKDTLYDLSFPKPPTVLQKRFQEIVGKYDAMILSRSRENQELIKLRDFLLPMLMNGQVKVKSEAKEQLSMAAEPQAEYKKSRT